MHNILIVDDEHTFLQSLADGLGDYSGYHIFTAGNGREAMEILRTTAIDLVVTDLKMPEMGGYELVAHMARKHPAVPVIVMTAFGNSEMEENFRALGVAGYLEKPLDFGDLSDCIADLLTDRPLTNAARLMSPSGDYLLRVLYEATSGMLDGETIVRRDSDIGRIFVARGRIAWVAASTVNESLFTCILDNTVVAMEDLRSAFDECRRTGSNFGETLIEWGLIERDAFYEILADYTARSLLEVLSWRETDVMFVPEQRTYKSSLTFDLDELLQHVRFVDVSGKLGFQMPDLEDVAAEAARRNAGIELALDTLSSLEGFINVGAFTANGALLAEVSAIGISLADVGALANAILLEAQRATSVAGFGRGSMVHISAPEAEILAFCHNEGASYDKSEPDRVHLHLVLLLQSQSNLALAKMRLRQVVEDLTPQLHQGLPQSGRLSTSTHEEER